MGTTPDTGVSGSFPRSLRDPVLLSLLSRCVSHRPDTGDFQRWHTEVMGYSCLANPPLMGQIRFTNGTTQRTVLMSRGNWYQIYCVKNLKHPFVLTVRTLA